MKPHSPIVYSMDRVARQLSRVASDASSGSRGKLKFETANLAKFSNGACTCSLGDTSVLVTAVSHQPVKNNHTSFLPLTVNYKQKAAAAGRIPMTHLRRDIGITEREVLIGRMIDRSIRPSFWKGFRNETQVICNLLAVDGHNDPDVLAINGASASLAISDIPWNGPIGAVRVGLVGDRIFANPSRKEQDQSRLDLVISANHVGNVIMMDGSCREPILMQDLVKAMKFGIKECRTIIEAIVKLQKSCGKPKRTLELADLPQQEHILFVRGIAQDKIKSVLANHDYDKTSRDEAMQSVREDVLSLAQAKFSGTDQSVLSESFNYAVRYVYRRLLAETRIRCDGRQLSDLRPIICQIDLYKPLHGSALFQRGQTQVLCSTTFDSPDAAFRTDSMTSIVSGVKEKNFMLHYDFPPYATNDIGRVGAMPDRREIGHGALAERGIRPLVPENQDLTIRLNCEVLESNGSSSMASVCAGSLSLMDAGVNISEHVAGVAMGLISDLDNGQQMDNSTSNEIFSDESRYSILTDILGFEDYIGDMDFKIAGTKKGVTALQLDVKPNLGVPFTVLYQAIQRAHVARSEIINKMDKVIKAPRNERKANHPVIKTIRIPQHKVAAFVGFGGANLKKLMAKIGVRVSAYGEIDANELGAANSDNFIVFAPNQEAMQEAEEYIKSIVEKQREPELEFNGIYTATIQEVRPNGVMVTLYQSMTPALLPLSQLDIRSVAHPSALNLEVGQQIQVKYFGRDPATGHMRLSRKSLMMTSVSRVHR
uniref:polyribonucleotide nucleotidyltransferase n=1 Tax=Aceria tosichella TaxID=561515 RepID=A0A6G1SI00_9ACAR